MSYLDNDEFPVKHPATDELPIEDHGIIGNMHSCALVSVKGSINYLCLPHFDSPSIFASILDHKQGGFFQITVDPHHNEHPVNYKQFYWPQTNLLITRFFTDHGVAQVIDFMPVKQTNRKWRNGVFRYVECIRGEINFKSLCYPSFNYARDDHVIEKKSDSFFIFRSKDNAFGLSGYDPHSEMTINMEQDGNGIRSKFTLKETEKIAFEFCLLENNISESDYEIHHCQQVFEQNLKYWRHWLSQCTYRGLWREMVERSALTLKLLTFEPTGAIIAAGTFGIPEQIGGIRNWDYRYTWIRDASFVVYALLRIGFREEASAFMGWLEDRCHEIGEEGSLKLMYGIHGEHDIPEIELWHLRGYKFSRPVRIGNAASLQLQLDVYGELMDSVYLFNKWARPVSFDLWGHLVRLLEWLSNNWSKPDNGIWEVRTKRGENFIYSRLMCWVAFDRAIRLADKRSFPSPRKKWMKIRDKIYLEIMEKGYNERLQSFVQSYESDALDASSLIMPLVFFVSPNDPRMESTIKAMDRPNREGGIVSGGLVYRYQPNVEKEGIPGEEGTFNMCSFWLIEALTRSGGRNIDEARLLFEQMMTFSNHLGLYSEETSKRGEMLGNFPQAFTHLALISSADRKSVV